MRHNPSKQAAREKRATESNSAPVEPTPRDLRPSQFGLGILRGLQSRPVYQGTADPSRVAADRARNKVARQSRRAGRGR